MKIITQIVEYNWFNEIKKLNNDQLLNLENYVRNEFTAKEAQS